MAGAVETVGTQQTSKTAGTSLPLTLPAVAAGKTVVVVFITDNAASTTTPTITAIPRGTGETNTWTKRGEFNSTTATAGGGVRGEIWSIQTSVAWNAINSANGVTLSASITAKALVPLICTGLTGSLRSTSGAGTSTTTTGATAATSGTAPTDGDLVFALAGNANTPTASAIDTDTTEGTWDDEGTVGTTGGSAATNVAGRIATKVIVTGGSQQSYQAASGAVNPNGACIVAFAAVALTAVNKDLALVWNVAQPPVGKNLDIRWNTVAAIGKALQLVWLVLTPVTKSLAFVWHVLSLVGLARQYLWNTRATVGQADQYLWNTRAVVAKNNQLVWNTNAIVGVASQFLWNVLFTVTGTVGKAIQFLYNVAAVVGPTRETNVVAGWNVGFGTDASEWVGGTNTSLTNPTGKLRGTRITSTGSISMSTPVSSGSRLPSNAPPGQYTVRFKVRTSSSFNVFATIDFNTGQSLFQDPLATTTSEQTVEFTQSALNAGNQYIAGITIGSSTGGKVVGEWIEIDDVEINYLSPAPRMLWNVRAAVGKSLDTPWNVGILASKTLTLRWNVRELLMLGILFRWAVRGSVGKSLQLLWSVVGWVARELNIKWNTATFVNKSLSLRWNVNELLMLGILFRWAVKGTTSKTIQFIWGVGGRVANELRLLWNALFTFSWVPTTYGSTAWADQVYNGSAWTPYDPGVDIWNPVSIGNLIDSYNTTFETSVQGWIVYPDDAANGITIGWNGLDTALRITTSSPSGFLETYIPIDPPIAVSSPPTYRFRARASHNTVGFIQASKGTPDFSSGGWVPFNVTTEWQTFELVPGAIQSPFNLLWIGCNDFEPAGSWIEFDDINIYAQPIPVWTHIVPALTSWS